MIREQSRTLCRLNECFVARLYALVPTGSRAEVENVLRISWNTWIKIRTGGPIRYSLALRLVTRVLGMESDASDPMTQMTLTGGGEPPRAVRQDRSLRPAARKQKIPSASSRTAARAG